MGIPDTHPDAEKVYIDLLRKFTISKKLNMVKEITFSCQQIALTGIKERYPGADEKEIRLRLAALWLPKDIMLRVFSWNVAEKGL